MYAVVQSGGKQYKVEPGMVVQVEKLPGEVGDPVTLDQVLLMADGEQIQVGRPVIEGASVSGKIVRQTKGPKIVIFKHKRRKDYRKKIGHRQHYTMVRIEDILSPGAATTREATDSQNLTTDT